MLLIDIVDLLTKNTTDDKSVLTFYVSSPWNHSISLVDLSSESVTDIYMCCSAGPEKKCYMPHYMTHAPYNTIVVTTNYGIFELSTITVYVELLTNQDGFLRGNQVLD